MVVSLNSNSETFQFQALLKKALSALQDDAEKKPKEYQGLGGTLFEKRVASMMSEAALGTPFQNSIVVFSGHKFPDIVAKKYFGVEVKTTIGNSWTSTGSSIMEGTRVPDVERIFLMFARLSSPIGFKCRPYEECLSEVVVTHSPRYLIDMDLAFGKTIFDKLGVSYDNLRLLENPIGPIIEYYKRHVMKPGEKLWWIDNVDSASSLIIKFWSQLGQDEKRKLKAEGYAFFPEVIASNYNKFSYYLATEKTILCPNVRDLFSAGGKESYVFEGKSFSGISKSIINVIKYADYVFEILIRTDVRTLSRHWEVKVPANSEKRIDLWIQKLKDEIGAGCKHFPLNEILSSKYKKLYSC